MKNALKSQQRAVLSTRQYMKPPSFGTTSGHRNLSQLLAYKPGDFNLQVQAASLCRPPATSLRYSRFTANQFKQQHHQPPTRLSLHRLRGRLRWSFAAVVNRANTRGREPDVSGIGLEGRSTGSTCR